MILTNPEGRKESDETIIQTDEDGACRKEKETFDCSEFSKIASFCNQPQMGQMLLANERMLGGQILEIVCFVFLFFFFILSRIRLFCHVFLLNFETSIIASFHLHQQFQEQFPANRWEPPLSKTEFSFTGKSQQNPTGSSYSMRCCLTAKKKNKQQENSCVAVLAWNNYQGVLAFFHNRSATLVFARSTPRFPSSGQGSPCPCPPTPRTTSFRSSTRGWRTSFPYARPPPKALAPRLRWMWPQTSQVSRTYLFFFFFQSCHIWVENVDRRGNGSGNKNSWFLCSPNNRRVRRVGGVPERDGNDYHRAAQAGSGQGSTHKVVKTSQCTLRYQQFTVKAME